MGDTLAEKLGLKGAAGGPAAGIRQMPRDVAEQPKEFSTADLVDIGSSKAADFGTTDEKLGLGAKAADTRFGRWLAGVTGIRGGLAEPDAPYEPPQVQATRGMGGVADPRTTYERTRDERRDLEDRAHAEEPGVQVPLLGKVGPIEATEMAGQGALVAAAAPAAAASGVGRIGQAAALGGVQGAANAAGASEADTPGGVMRDTAVGGGAGLTIGGLAGGVGEFAKKLVQGGDWARGMAAGGRSLPRGESVAAYGRAVNEAGLPGMAPRSVHGYERAAEAAADVKGADLGAVRDAASAAGKGASSADVFDALRSLRNEALTLNNDTGDKMARTIEAEIARIQKGAGPRQDTGAARALGAPLDPVEPIATARQAISPQPPAHTVKPVPKQWAAAYELGKKLQGQSAREYLNDDAAAALVENHEISDPIHVFFQAGQRGKEMPVWTEGRRIGEIPEGGRSWNHRDQRFEDGVSILGEGVADETDGTYRLFNGGRPEIRVGGWLNPYLRGTDGEPLLTGAVKLPDNPAEIKIPSHGAPLEIRKGVRGFGGMGGNVSESARAMPDAEYLASIQPKTVRPGRARPTEVGAPGQVESGFDPTIQNDMPFGPEAQMSARELADRATDLRSKTEGGYGKRGEPATPKETAAATAKRDIANAYSGLEDQAVNDPAHRKLKDDFGFLADVQNNAAVQGGNGGRHIPLTWEKVAADVASNYGADAAAKGAYAVGRPLEQAVRMHPAATAAVTQQHRASDTATRDPHYGRMLQAVPQGAERDVTYNRLVETDPEFRQRVREFAEQHAKSQR